GEECVWTGEDGEASRYLTSSHLDVHPSSTPLSLVPFTLFPLHPFPSSAKTHSLTTEQRIQQMHRDEVKSLPPSSRRLASPPSCPVQAMHLPGRYITVQGHPEFTADIVREVCEVRHNTGLFSDDMYEDAVERAGWGHDGVEIARAFV